MYNRLFFAIALTLLHTFAYSDQSAPPTLKLVVNDLRVNALVIGAADALQFNAAIGGYSNERLSAAKEFKSEQEFLDYVANSIDARVTNIKDVTVFSNKCVGSPVTDFNPFHGISLSFHFTEFQPSSILNLLHVATQKSTKWKIPPANFGLVGMHLKDVDIHSIYDILVATSGVTVAKNTSGKLIARQTTSCIQNRNKSFDVLLPDIEGKECPKRASAMHSARGTKCSSLEYYELENIVLRGYLQVGEKYFSFAETPDGLNWIISKGMFLGYDYGHVFDISNKGISITEIQLNPYGYWYEQKILFDYQNNRRPILEK